jgi:HEAT repeats
MYEYGVTQQAMDDFQTFPDERRGGPSRPPLGTELLPPVEAPSARFIVQLFVVPALIVLSIVGIWLLISSLVRSATIDPAKVIEGIEQGPSVARWQRASELADMLNSSSYGELKRNHEQAAHLARILDREIENTNDGNDSQEASTLRYFLARALGRFEVNDGTDVLLKAAETKRTPNDELVRHSAIEAIAVRAYNLQHIDPPEQLTNPELGPTLIRLAGDQDATIRSAATYALGQLGTPAAIAKLEVAVNDLDEDTRYNAAVALAHRGNAKSVETLAEMLDLSEMASKKAEKPSDEAAGDADPGIRREVIIASAIDAAHALARKNPQADLSKVIKALEQLSTTDKKTFEDAHVSPHVASDAKRALGTLTSHR